MTHPRAEYLREYHLKNKEKRNARSKEHYYNNVEEITRTKEKILSKAQRRIFNTSEREEKRE